MNHVLRTVAVAAFLTAITMLLIGCGNPITAPTPVAAMAGADRTITITYTCTTQPRLYALPSGAIQWEIDTYTQATPCPAIPIN